MADVQDQKDASDNETSAPKDKSAKGKRKHVATGNPRGRPPKGKDTEGAARREGTGIKPKKRVVKQTTEDKNKNRLRLIISEIQAGNNNPKLIIELNKLYKNLYNIDNAFMFLKK